MEELREEINKNIEKIKEMIEQESPKEEIILQKNKLDELLQKFLQDLS